MAINFVENGAAAAVNATTVTPTMPPNAAGDFLIAWLSAKGTSVSISNEADWTDETQFGASGHGGQLKHRFSTGGLGDPTFDKTPSQTFLSQISRYRGVDQANPLDVAVSAANSGTTGSTDGVVTFPSITTATDGCKILRFAIQEEGDFAASWGSPAAGTVRVEAETDLGQDSGFIVIEESQATAGATGTNTITLTAPFADWYAVTIALRPATGLVIDNVGDAGGSVANGAGSNVTINSGSGNNRILVIPSAQENTSDISSITVNGVNATFSAGSKISHPDQASNKAEFWYMLDADLPATAGTYTMVVNGPAHTRQYVSYTGAAQEAPQDVDTNSSTSQATITSGTLTVATAGSKLLTSVMLNTLEGWSEVANQALLNFNGGSPSGYDWVVYEKDADTDTTIAATSASAASRQTQSSIIIAPSGAAPTGPVVNSTTPTTPNNGQAGVVINGLNFGATQGASTVTYNGITLTVTNWTDTAITVNWPDIAVDSGTGRFNTDLDLVVTVA